MSKERFAISALVVLFVAGCSSPKYEEKPAPVVRTDFSDDTSWKTVCNEMSKSGPYPNFTFINDPANANITTNALAKRLGISPLGFVFVADGISMHHKDHPLLVIDLSNGTHSSFRAVPSAAYSIEVNLSLANMDFEDFASSVDSNDKIFRRFPRP